MSGWDPYLDLTTGVLRNRLGITDPATFAHAEAELTALRIAELRVTPLPGRYDLPHLQSFHRFIFKDLFEWAGELRSVSIAKGDLFCLPQFLVPFAEDVFGKLQHDRFLQGLERPQFVTKLADLLADLNALHPFREGNGRTQRAYVAQLSREAGHPIRWEAMDPAVNIAASQAAHRGDNEPLRAMLDGLVAGAPSSSSPDQVHPARQAASTLSPPSTGPSARPSGRAEMPHQRGKTDPPGQSRGRRR